MEDRYKNIIVLELDKPTLNGNVYPKEVVEKALREVRLPFYGTVDMPNPSRFSIDLDKISHRITDLRVEGNNLVCNIQPIGPHARLIDELWDHIDFRTAGYAQFEQSGDVNVVTEYHLLTISAVNKWPPTTPEETK